MFHRHISKNLLYIQILANYMFCNSYKTYNLPSSLWNLPLYSNQKFLSQRRFKQLSSLQNSIKMADYSDEFSNLSLDPFCWRQFDDPKFPGAFIDMNRNEFLEKVISLIQQEKPQIHNGYAPFCKHIFIPNFTNATISTIAISPENANLLRSGYVSRRPEELAVLCRWFCKSDVTKYIVKAKYLDLILYSREQIAKENAAMKMEGDSQDASPWSIISIKAQNEPFELPMNPITMMRNTLIDHGGSGVPIDRLAYSKSVEYWQNHAIVQADN